MRFSGCFLCLFIGLTSVDAAPRAYGYLPLFNLPRSVPGSGVTDPSLAKAPQAPGPIQPAQPGNSGTAPSSSPGNTAPVVRAQSCAADVDRLASGIQQNILDQQGELATAQGLLGFLQNAANKPKSGINSTAASNNTTTASSPDKNVGSFLALKGQLLAFVTAGIAIRAGNQAIAPSGSPAASGLAQVANAQQGELALASSLTGDASVDVATVQSLIKAFSGGIKLNMQNLLDATQNCTPTDAIARSGVQVALRAGLKAVLPVRIPVDTPDVTVAGEAQSARKGSA